MKRDAIIFGVSGTIFGLLVGWIIGTQQVTQAPAPAAATTTSAASPQAANAAPPPFDATRAAELERRATAEPANATLRADIGNLYFDAERYQESIPWYEAAYKLDGKNVSVSTDLAVAYYYTNQVDRALAQIDRSLAIDGKHLKTLLNQGIIRAWGKQDLLGAAKAWEQVVAIAPNSEEGRRAQQGLEALRATAHQATGQAPTGAAGTTP